MTDLIEYVKLATAVATLVTALVGLSAARERVPKRKKKGHRR